MKSTCSPSARSPLSEHLLLSTLRQHPGLDGHYGCDVMCLFCHVCSFSEMVIEREVKCYIVYLCTCGFGLICLILMGFCPVLVCFAVCCPAVKAFEDH